MIKENCAATNEGSNLNNPLSTVQVRLCEALKSLPTAALLCCASQMRRSYIHCDFPEACLSSHCERTLFEGQFSYLSSNYSAFVLENKDS